MVILQDLRYALRQLLKAPGFTITAVVTLALGIGANTAIFTLVHALILKSLPVVNPSQLYRIGDNDLCCVYGGLQNYPDGWGVFSYPLYQYFVANTPEFEQIAAFQANKPQISVRRMGAESAAETFPAEFVSGNYFSTFGIQPFAGRMFTPQDDTAAAAPAIVMSYRAWQQRYGMDPSVVGATFMVNGRPFTVIGIAPPGFFGDRLREDPPDLYIPLAFEPAINQKSSILHIDNQHWLYLIGRMKPGVQPAQVQSQLTTELRQWLPTIAGSFPPEWRAKIPQQVLKVGPGGAGITALRNEYKSGLYMLIAASALVLLIACANLANLLLARATARRQQIAVQLALGATRRRLIRSLLSESILLACMGGAAGLGLAYWGTRGILLVAFRGASFVPLNNRPSLPILAFTFALSLLTGIIFGVAPAWIASHSDPAEALRGASRSTRDRSAMPQKSLVIAQAAFSLVLLAMAGLVTESLRNLEHYSFGFDTHSRLMVQINPRMAGYTLERLPALYQQIRDRLGEIPGVRSVSYSMYSPQDGDSWNSDVAIAGRPARFLEDMTAGWVRVSPNYFATIGTPVLRGRDIGEQDTPTSQRVAVIDESFARRFFPHEDPLGRHFGFDLPGHSADYEIVGVVKDTRYRSPDDRHDPQNPMFFVSYFQTVQYDRPNFAAMEAQSEYANMIEVRYSGTEAEIAPQVRRVMAGIDPNLSIIDMHSFGEQVVRVFNQERLIARLTELFSLLALLLASIGLYGVTAYNIARRTSEIGVRMALGATRGHVVVMVLRGAFRQIGLGLVIGIPLVIVAGRLMASRLYGVGAFNPLIVAGAVLVLALCAFFAGIFPARRAASIEPVQALRIE
ncbi:MAG TPA: ABC transporter permease [Candidatus Binatia bacterium]|nr:ABC transporter permease [Candidatus Binatia bacterium]